MNAVFGGLWRDSTLSYAVQQFFQNGGTDALIVRVHNGGNQPPLPLAAGFNLVAANPGKWGEKLRVRWIITLVPISRSPFRKACSIFPCGIR